ncbi:MAG: SGNH/GDSL hydrolase family protein [Phycisphaerae bacterium]
MSAAPARPAAPRRRPSLRFKLAAIGLSLMGCLVLLELYFRIFWTQPVFRIDPRHYQPEPWPFAFRFKPGQRVHIPFPEIHDMDVDVNGDGFRGPDLAQLATRRLRVVSIGDSFTFGWGLPNFEDQCVVGFVSDYARAHPAADAGLSVVAEPGWGPRDYFFAYAAYARAARPQLVIVGFFCGDDIVTAGTIASIATGTPPAKPWSVSRAWWRPATLDWARFRIRSSPALTRFMLGAGARPESDLVRFLRDEPPPVPQMWDETFRLLAALAAEVRANGGRLAIVAYPSLIQVFAHQQLDDARFDYAHIEKRLAEFCRAESIEFVPMLDALIADGRLDLYYARDRHLTPRGHAVCKRVLAERLGPLLDELARPEHP